MVSFSPHSPTPAILSPQNSDTNSDLIDGFPTISSPHSHPRSPYVTQASLVSLFSKHKCLSEMQRHLVSSVLYVKYLHTCSLSLPVTIQVICFSLLLVAKQSSKLQSDHMHASGTGGSMLSVTPVPQESREM